MPHLRGSCLCGAIYYCVYGEPSFVTHCHCHACRKASGSLFVTWFTVRACEVEWHGEPLMHYHSSCPVERGFCPHCGTTLTYRHEADPDSLDITLASLEQPELIMPEHHTWWQEHVPWVEPEVWAGLPHYTRAKVGK